MDEMTVPEMKARCFDLIKQAEAHQIAIRQIQVEITQLNQRIEEAEKAGE